LPLQKKEYEKIKQYAKENMEISLGQLLSIRNQLKIQKEIIKSKISDISTIKIINSYKKLIKNPNLSDITINDINDFYAKTNLPVIAVLKLLKKQHDFKSMDHHLLKKFYQITKDISKSEHISRVQSKKFENMIENYISKLGISFQTEEQ